MSYTRDKFVDTLKRRAASMYVFRFGQCAAPDPAVNMELPSTSSSCQTMPKVKACIVDTTSGETGGSDKLFASLSYCEGNRGHAFVNFSKSDTAKQFQEDLVLSYRSVCTAERIHINVW